MMGRHSYRSSGLTAATFVVFVLFAVVPSAFPLSLPVCRTKPGAEPSLAIGRSLLQAKHGCPVNFENMNYTIITSRCKGPNYPSDICCEAFKDFACPYAGQLNDLTNNCANTMFSYINLFGKYPPGLFANVCLDSKQGLECTAAQSNPHSTSSATPPQSSHTVAKSNPQSTSAATPSQPSPTAAVLNPQSPSSATAFHHFPIFILSAATFLPIFWHLDLF